MRLGKPSAINLSAANRSEWSPTWGTCCGRRSMVMRRDCASQLLTRLQLLVAAARDVGVYEALVHAGRIAKTPDPRLERSLAIALGEMHGYQFRVAELATEATSKRHRKTRAEV